MTLCNHKCPKMQDCRRHIINAPPGNYDVKSHEGNDCYFASNSGMGRYVHPDGRGLNSDYKYGEALPLFESGVSIKDIAAKYDTSYAAIYQAINAAKKRKAKAAEIEKEIREGRRRRK